MALIRCDKGHYYDNKKFIQCPQCGLKLTNTASDESVTVRLSDVSHSDKNDEPDDVKTKKMVYADGRQEKTYSKGLVTGWLVCFEGPSKGRDFRIFYGHNFVGRAFDMDICVEEDYQVAEKKHCSIVYDDKNNKFYLVPGKGVTYFRGEILENAVELNGVDALIQIGESQFYFVPYCNDRRRW